MTHDRTHFRRIPALLLLFALLLPAAVPALAAGPEGPGALSQAGADFLKARESFSETPYTDGTNWYVGYGTQCQAGAYAEGITEEEADRLLDLLFNQYIGTDRNVYTSRAKKYAVINPILMALENHAGSCTEYRMEEYTRNLSEAKDGQKLLKLLHEGFGYLIRWQQKRQLDQKENIAERARQYINLNFEDPMIGLYSISDMLGVSNTYLSTTFKKKYGIGIAQYINSLRIEKAKRLIVNTDENIKEIALSVGFSSDAAFIRVFKQFENTTPGRYKKK